MIAKDPTINQSVGYVSISLEVSPSQASIISFAWPAQDQHDVVFLAQLESLEVMMMVLLHRAERSSIEPTWPSTRTIMFTARHEESFVSI